MCACLRCTEREREKAREGGGTYVWAQEMESRNKKDKRKMRTKKKGLVGVDQGVRSCCCVVFVSFSFWRGWVRKERGCASSNPELRVWMWQRKTTKKTRKKEGGKGSAAFVM